MIRHLALALAATAGLTAAETFAIDPSHTTALYRISHMGVSDNYGRFNAITGSVTLDAANPAANQVTIVVKTASIDTDNEKRDQHLKSADFLNAKQFPEMSFVSTGWKTADGRHQVTGNFTLAGVTRPLTVEVTSTPAIKDPWGLTRAGFATTFTIKRSDFGMKGVPGVGDEVTIIFSAEATHP